MCGRYTLFKLDQFLRDFPNLEFPFDFQPRYNVAPTQLILAISNTQPQRLEFFHWGLVPSWAKDPSIGNRMINARAETLAGKSAFKTALRRRRCLIPADGFYEWRKEGGGHKTPMYIHLRSGQPFAFAGLWEQWHSPDGSVLPSATIITTAPNALMEAIHDRMPAIVHAKDYARWLAVEETSPDAVADVLAPFPAEEMEAYPVSPRVNRPAHDAPDCIEKSDTGLLF
jgi:putative SOS response-associated peptidase YedK